MVDYDNLQKSLKHLEIQFENHGRTMQRPELTQIDREAIAESVIQRFKTCYDSLWKNLKHHMVENLGLPNIPNSPKPIFKLAGQNDLLPSPVEQWLKYADARIDTTHDYSGNKAAEALSVVKEFIGDAKALYQNMTGTTWQ